MKLLHKFLFPMLGLIFIAVISSCIFTFFQTSEKLKTLFLDDMQRSVVLLNRATERWMDDRYSDVTRLARSDLLVRSVGQSFVSKASRIVVSKRLRESPETTDFYNTLYLVDGTQTILAASSVFETGDHLPEIYSEIAQEAWAFIKSPRQVFQGSFRDENGRFHYFIASRIHKEDKRSSSLKSLDGLLLAEVNMQVLVDSIFMDVKIGQSGRAVLYHEDGIPVGNASGNIASRFSTLSYQDNMAVDWGGKSEGQKDNDVLVAYKMQRYPWVVSALIDRHEFTDPAYEIAYNILYVGVGIIMLAALVLVFLLKWVLRPIQSLSATAEAISLGKDYTLRAHKFSNDELGKLVTVFNDMLSQIAVREQELSTAKDKMFEQKNFLDTLIEHLPMALIAKDVKDDYRYVAFNKEAENTFGFKAKEMIGTFDHDHFSKEDADLFVGIDKQVIAGGTLVKSEQESITTKPKGTFIAQTFKIPIYNKEGMPVLLLGLTQDVTERINEQEELKVAKQSAEDANRAKSEFLAKMSHELRTPLNSIMGLSDLLLEEEMDADHADMVSVMKRSSNMLLETVNDILDISKIEDGAVVLENIPFDFGDISLGIVETLAPLASQKGLLLRRDVPQDLPYVIGDPTRVKRILINLIGNALKYTLEGSVDVVVRAEHISETDVQITCDIKDTGIGISEEGVAIVFDKFTQADESISRKFGGTGLGLAITKQLVELMGGHVSVTSTKGKGSVFSFTLPLKISETLDEGVMDEIREEHIKLDGSQIPVERARVLMADDHELNQIFLKRLLKNLGFNHLDIASDGKEALELFRANSYDLVLMDCHMPQMNGYQATEAIREYEKGKEKRTPIIAMTADAMVGVREACLEVGMDEYITKPVDAKRFVSLLRHWIDFSNSTSDDGLIEEKDHQGSEFENMPVNLGNLKKHSRGDDAFMKEIIALFVTQGATQIERIKNYCVDGVDHDWVEISHALKGTSGGVGAESMRALCADAQGMASASAEERKTILVSIEQEYMKAKDYLIAQNLYEG